MSSLGEPNEIVLRHEVLQISALSARWLLIKLLRVTIWPLLVSWFRIAEWLLQAKRDGLIVFDSFFLVWARCFYSSLA